MVFKRLVIEVEFADGDNKASFEKMIDAKAKAIYLETVGNRAFKNLDFNKLAAIDNDYEIPLVVDNTFDAARYLTRLLEQGANKVVKSAMKWIGGHGTSIGCIIVDGGNCNWGNGKYPQFT